MRKKIVAGNWKMNGSLAANAALLDLLKQGNLILAEKKGQYIIYSLNRSGFELVHAWFQGFAQYFEFPKPKIRL